jgi:hypothetical protein
MKKIILLCLSLVLFSPILLSQESNSPEMDDIGRIGFYREIIPNNDISGSAVSNLISKFDRMVLNESIGSSVDERFGLILNPVVISEEITSTTPKRYFYELGIDIYAIDYQEKTTLGIFSIDGLNGINTNKQRAIIASLRSFTPNKNFKVFINEVKDKIISYYNSRCDFIITDALTLSTNDNFDDALILLSSIPEVSSDCFEKSRNEMTNVYKNKLNRDCQSRVSNAKGLIAQEKYKEAASILQGILPGVDCYDEAMSLIAEIEDYWCSVNLGKARSFKAARNFDEAAKFLALVPTSSSCASQAEKLSNEIFSTLTAIDQREWEFKIKKYTDQQDMLIREFDFEVNKFERVQNREDNAQDFEFSNFDRIQKADRDLQRILSREVIRVSRAKSRARNTTKVKKDYSFLGIKED